MHTLRTSHYALTLALALGFAAQSKAQVATTPAGDSTGSANTASQAAIDQPVVLSTFTVDTSSDRGYTAVNSLAGGRNDTPLAITPSSVSSLTKEFIDDLQLTNATDALKWTMNAVPANFAPNVGSGNEFNSWADNIRGAGAGPQGGTPPTVNFFPIYAIKDFFNVDRYELDLGPNSILFGVGSLGGVATSYTKVPRFDHDFIEADLIVNSYGGARATFDINEKLSLLGKDDFAFRVNLLADRDENWRKDDDIKKLGVSIATALKLTSKSTLRFDAEAYSQVTPQFAENMSDQYSQWNGQVNSPTWGATPVTGTGAAAPANSYNSMAEWGGPNSFQLWIPQEGTILNWGAGYRGAGLADAPYYMNAVMRPYAYTLIGTGQVVPALPSSDFTVGPLDGTNTLKYYTLTAYFDQTINKNSEFELSAYRFADTEDSKNFESPSNVSVDINKQLPNGQSNPEYGMLYSDMFLDRQIQDHSVNEVRAQVNYHFDTSLFNVPIKEWLSASAGDQFHLLSTREYNGSYDGYPQVWNGSNWTQDMIWAREYWNDPHASINLPAVYNGNAISYQALPFNWYDNELSEQIEYEGIVSQTRLWDDRLNVTLGARHDEYESDKYSPRGTQGLPFPQGHTYEDDTGDTYSAGFVGYVTKWLAATYNYSENFAPIGGGQAPSLFGDAFGPAMGKSNEYGLRVSTEDHKYYISADVYKDTASGKISGDNIPIQGIWNDYYKAGGTATDIGPAGTLSGTAPNLATQFNYADTVDQKDTGYEISATANPTENWKFQVSYAAPKVVSTNDLPGSRAYFADHLTEWSAIANGGTKLDGQVLADLNSAEQTLANTASSANQAGVVNYTFNVVGAYTFTETALKGLTVGAGATSIGEQEISTGGVLYSPSYTTYIAFLSYSTAYDAFGKRVHVKYQLNVDNLTDDRTLVFTGFNQVGGAAQGSNYYLIDPRKFTFSVILRY